MRHFEIRFWSYVNSLGMWLCFMALKRGVWDSVASADERGVVVVAKSLRDLDWSREHLREEAS